MVVKDVIDAVTSIVGKDKNKDKVVHVPCIGVEHTRIKKGKETRYTFQLTGWQLIAGVLGLWVVGALAWKYHEVFVDKEGKSYGINLPGAAGTNTGWGSGMGPWLALLLNPTAATVLPAAVDSFESWEKNEWSKIFGGKKAADTSGTGRVGDKKGSGSSGSNIPPGEYIGSKPTFGYLGGMPPP
jgi:hypothetical protein